MLRWGDAHRRDLPWRDTRDPWSILVAEVMLGQTQVPRVLVKWPEFLRRWPTPTQCGAAPLADLLVAWSGLGYPRRCRNLHLAAQQLVDRHAGEVPADLDDLLALPGVGPYTARAVLAFAFERDVGVVDTNIARVLARTAGRRLTQRAAQAAADARVPAGTGWAWNQTVMDVGAVHCRPLPRCTGCPFESTCAWRAVLSSATSSDSDPEIDPATGSAGVSTRQGRFEGSDRQLRGRVMATLVAGPRRTQGVVDDLTDDEMRARRVLEGLVADGLVVRTDDTLALPG